MFAYSYAAATASTASNNNDHPKKQPEQRKTGDITESKSFILQYDLNIVKRHN